jgi:hypothetical protein
MELLDENGDAFDVRIFWRPSAFSQDTDIAFSELFPRPELDGEFSRVSPARLHN